MVSRMCFIHHTFLGQSIQLFQSSLFNEFRCVGDLSPPNGDNSFGNFGKLDDYFSSCIDRIRRERKGRDSHTEYGFSIHVGQLYSTELEGMYNIDQQLLNCKVLKYKQLQINKIVTWNDSNLTMEKDRVKYDIEIKYGKELLRIEVYLDVSQYSECSHQVIPQSTVEPERNEKTKLRIELIHLLKRKKRFKRLDFLDPTHPHYSIRMNFCVRYLNTDNQAIPDPLHAEALRSYMQRIQLKENFEAIDPNKEMEIKLPDLPEGYTYHYIRKSDLRNYRFDCEEEFYFRVLYDVVYKMEETDFKPLRNPIEISFVNPMIEKLLCMEKLDEDQIKREIEKAWQYGERVMKRFTIQYS